jgi:hypothetical protein
MPFIHPILISTREAFPTEIGSKPEDTPRHDIDAAVLT